MEVNMSLCRLTYSDTFQDSSFINIAAKSTVTSEITHHLLGPDAIPKQSLVRIYAIFCTIVMHNNAHLACQCNLLYAESKSCLNTSILLFGFLYLMCCKLCRTRSMHLPYCSGANFVSSILLFIEKDEGPSHEQS